MSNSIRKSAISGADGKVLSKRELAKQEEAQKAKKTKTITIIVIAVCLVLLACALLMNSNFIRRQGKAFSVDGMDFTPAEFTFHYYNYYYDYVEYVYTEAYDYASMLLPDTTTSLEAQEYSDGVTWKDHFEEYCEDSLKEDVALYNEGKSVGFEMTDEEMQEYQDEIDGLATSASSMGYSDVDKYLANYYGPACTYEIVKEQLLFLYYANDYEDYYINSIQFSDEELEAQYETKKDYYDSFTFRYFIVYPEDVDESLYDTDEALEAAKDEALTAAHAEAEEIMSGIKSEKDFIQAAYDYDSEKYETEDSTSRTYNGDLLGSTYGPWLREADRTSGDMELFDISAGTYVVMFLDRTDNSYLTRNCRTILVIPEDVDEDDYEDEEDDTAYEAAVQEAKDAAYAEAQELMEEYQADPTEDNFAQLAIDNSDSENASEGGLWECANKDSLADEVSEWLFDADRKTGDVELIWAEDVSGYYLVYYIGEDMPYNLNLAQTELETDAKSEWETQLTANSTTKRTWMYSLI